MWINLGPVCHFKQNRFDSYLSNAAVVTSKDFQNWPLCTLKAAVTNYLGFQNRTLHTSNDVTISSAGFINRLLHNWMLNTRHINVCISWRLIIGWKSDYVAFYTHSKFCCTNGVKHCQFEHPFIHRTFFTPVINIVTKWSVLQNI